jgi:hypothetical protein
MEVIILTYRLYIGGRTMDEKKRLIRVIMMAIVFVLLFVGLVFAEQLGSTVVTVIRLVAIVLAIISLGFYNKKLR